jgi:hypothetical protein
MSHRLGDPGTVIFSSAASYAGAGFSLAAGQNYWLRFTDGTYLAASDVNCWKYVDFKGASKIQFCWECQITAANGWGSNTPSTTHSALLGVADPARPSPSIVTTPEIVKIAPVAPTLLGVGSLLEGRSLDRANNTIQTLDTNNILFKNSIVFDGLAASDTHSIMQPFWIGARGARTGADSGVAPYGAPAFDIAGLAGMWLAFTFNTNAAWLPTPRTIVHTARLSMMLLGD